MKDRIYYIDKDNLHRSTARLAQYKHNYLNSERNLPRKEKSPKSCFHDLRIDIIRE